jgi:hypothetical protein
MSKKIKMSFYTFNNINVIDKTVIKNITAGIIHINPIIRNNIPKTFFFLLNDE